MRAALETRVETPRPLRVAPATSTSVSRSIPHHDLWSERLGRMDDFEQTINSFADNDLHWWPFLFLRPERYLRRQ